jgi:transcriptional regulator with XRE-family HTH domain
MEPGLIILDRRLELGLGEQEVADAVGISTSSYSDIERCSSEALTVAHLGVLKGICQKLGLNVLEVIGERCWFCELSNSFPTPYLQSRHILVATKRRELG